MNTTCHDSPGVAPPTGRVTRPRYFRRSIEKRSGQRGMPSKRKAGRMPNTSGDATDDVAGQLSLTTLIFRVISNGLFDVFDAATLSDVEGELQWVPLGCEEALFRQGEPGDAMYVLTRGRLQITVESPDGTELVIDELEPGVTVGEMALLTGQPRVATVSAAEEAELVRLSRAAFDRLTAKNPAAMKRFAEAIVPRLQRTQLVDVLNALLGPLTTPALHEMQARLEWRHLANGETLFRPGDPGDSLYIVVNGRFARVAQHPDGQTRVVGEVSRGELIGELELLAGGVHATTVLAVRDSDVVRLTRPSFEHLLEQYPHAMMRIAQTMARGLQSGLASPSRQGSTVVALSVIPVSRDVPLRAFAQRPVDELVRSGPALYLNSERIDSLVGKQGIAQTPEDHPANITLASWLSRQESQYRYIVYEADPVWSDWTSRCVRQADRILLVGRAELDPGPGAIETEIRQLRVAGRQDLVLLQPESRPHPTGTAKWLEARSVETHHHVRLHRDADIARLVRRLTGRSLGLVLGGGGARGWAHIGVIRALEEVGLHADLVGGTSMGALMAAGYVQGMDPDVLIDIGKRFGSPRKLFDYTIPLISLFTGKKLTHLLHTTCGDVHIEDLWCPFFSVSSSLTRARSVVHRQGPLWKAVRASISIPGVFAPLVDAGELLVDGGLTNELPVDVMCELVEGGTVIASTVAPERELAAPYAWGSSISGWTVLRRRLNPFTETPRPPSILEILSRSKEISNVYQRRMQLSLADLVIASPVGQFAGMDFRPVEAIAEVGYQAGRQAIEAWRRNG